MPPNLIKQSPNRSRIMPDIEDKTSPTTINLKTNMFSHSSTLAPTIQLQKPSTVVEKIYSTKPRLFCFHSSKIEGTN